mgnify:CR=1 FL=1
MELAYISTAWTKRVHSLKYETNCPASCLMLAKGTFLGDQFELYSVRS